MSPVEKMSPCSVPHALRRVYGGKHCGKVVVAKVADFTTVCPKSLWKTRCNGRSGQRGTCTNISFIRRSWNFRETGFIVFTKMERTEKPNVEFCVRKRQSVEFEWNSAQRKQRSLVPSKQDQTWRSKNFLLSHSMS